MNALLSILCLVVQNLHLPARRIVGVPTFQDLGERLASRHQLTGLSELASLPHSALRLA